MILKATAGPFLQTRDILKLAPLVNKTNAMPFRGHDAGELVMMGYRTREGFIEAHVECRGPFADEREAADFSFFDTWESE
nr:hypothetical protein [uncultured Rhodopila sp.]